MIDSNVKYIYNNFLTCKSIRIQWKLVEYKFHFTFNNEETKTLHIRDYDELEKLNKKFAICLWKGVHLLADVIKQTPDSNKRLELIDKVYEDIELVQDILE